MADDERRTWNERYRSGTYQPRSAAAPFLESWLPRIGGGRALDIACGAGRNALRVADVGYKVDAIDISREGIEMARAVAAKRRLTVNWIVADLDDYEFELAAYDLVTVIRYVNRSLWPRLIAALAPDGWLLIEHHMHARVEVGGPSTPDFRLRPQELLRAFASLRIVYYEESIEPADGPQDADNGRFAIARMAACNGNPGF